MAELLLALEGPALHRRWLVLGATLVAAIAGGLLLARREASQPTICRDPERALAGVWDAPSQARLRARFVGTGQPYAENTWRTARQALDEYVSRWGRLVGETCGSLSEGGSTEAFHVRMACLAERFTEVAALVDLFGAADAATVERAAEAAQALSPLVDCADPKRARASLPTPPDAATRKRVAATRGDLARAKALRDAGKYAQARTLAEQATQAARPLGYRPLEAEALLLSGELQQLDGDLKTAESTLRAAVLAAEAGGHDAALADAALALARLVGDAQARHDEGLQWAERAAAVIERLGGDCGREAKRLGAVGAILWERGDYDAALASSQRSLALREELAGPESLDAADAREALGVFLRRQGLGEAALAEYHRALAIYQRLLGADHPRVAPLLGNMGIVLQTTHRLAEAREHYERALAIQDQTGGGPRPLTAWLLNNLGVVHHLLADDARARPLLERSLTLRQRLLGNDHPDVAQTLMNLGNVLASGQQHQEARARYLQALAIHDRVLGSDHPRSIALLDGMARSLYGEKRYAEALAAAERSVAIGEARLGADHPDLAHSLEVIGRVHLERHRRREAAVFLARALRLREAADPDDQELAPLRAALAKARGRAANAAAPDREVRRAPPAPARSTEAPAGR